MRIIAMAIATLAALGTASAVEYIGGEQITYSDGRQAGGVYLSEWGVLAIWTSKATADGPIYGVSILPRSDIKSRKAMQAGHRLPPVAHPVWEGVFLPDSDTLLAGDKAGDVLAAIGLKGEPAQMADQARTRLAAIKAAAIKLIKP